MCTLRRRRGVAERRQVRGRVEQQQRHRRQGDEHGARRTGPPDLDVGQLRLRQRQQQQDGAEAGSDHRFDERQVDRAQPGPHQCEKEAVRARG